MTVIQQKIYEIRGQKMMLDFDLAILYKVGTKVLNQAVKRNKPRFPKDLMIKLTRNEWATLKEHIIETDTAPKTMRSQFVTASQKKRNLSRTPYAFTEHGLTMLACVLKSPRAIKMNLAIVRAFITLRDFAMNYKDLVLQIKDIRQTVSNHSEQLNQIYDAIENMLEEKEDKKEKQRQWKERERIGFKTAKTR